MHGGVERVDRDGVGVGLAVVAVVMVVVTVHTVCVLASSPSRWRNILPVLCLDFFLAHASSRLVCRLVWRWPRSSAPGCDHRKERPAHSKMLTHQIFNILKILNKANALFC